MINFLFLSNWMTCALLVVLAWFTYNYSTHFVETPPYWRYITAGFVFLAIGNLSRPLFLLGVNLAHSLLFSVIGALLLFYGFFMLYKERKV